MHRISDIEQILYTVRLRFEGMSHLPTGEEEASESSTPEPQRGSDRETDSDNDDLLAAAAAAVEAEEVLHTSLFLPPPQNAFSICTFWCQKIPCVSFQSVL